MSEKKNVYSEIVKPIVVLVVICLVVSGLLGITNAITAPIIEQNKAAAALKDRQELLPNATGFTEVTYDDPHVKSVHVDDGGTGMIVVVEMTGYGGIVTTTVAVDPDGNVLHLRINANTETKGVGTKVTLPAFMDQFIGLNSESKPISTITGATYSSKTVIDSVNLALKVFDSVKGA